MPTRIAPRSFLLTPEDFGRKKDPDWKSTAEGKQVGLAEAAVQHEVSLAVLDDLALSSMSMRDLALRVEEDVDYLRRRLHGEVRAELKHYFAWAFVLGVHVLTPRLAPQSLDELIPPAVEDRQLRLA